MRKTLVIVSSVVALFVAGLFGAQFVLKSTIRRTLERAVAGMGVTVDTGRISIDFASRSVVVRDVRIHSQHNDTAFDSGSALVSFDAEIDMIRARGVRYAGRKNKFPFFAADVGLCASRVAMVTRSGVSGGTVLEAGGVDLHITDFSGATLGLDSLAVTSRIGESDLTSAVLRGVDIAGIDFAGVLGQSEAPGNKPALRMDSVSLTSADIRSDKNKKVASPSHVKPMIQQTIQRLPFALDVRTLAFADVDVEYDEIPAGGDSRTGKFILTDGRGTMKNITNIVIGHDRFFTVELTAMLMHSGLMHTVCRFPVDSLDDHWEITGRVGATDMKAFNPVLVPLMNVRLTSGTMQSLDFSMTGTLALSHTKLTMRYSDLEVEVLKKHNPALRHEFLTLLVGDVLVRSDNPGRNGNGPLRSAESSHPRDPERSMYNYIWHSLTPAIVKTVM